MMYFDGSKRVEGAVVVLISPKGEKLKYVEFPASIQQ
jgi:hypothetical protein